LQRSANETATDISEQILHLNDSLRQTQVCLIADVVVCTKT